jgi:topoisomerase-4 subunit A
MSLDTELAEPGTPSDVPFDSALSERYLVYALSTITARSLPDVRDGLKPVHRRLLWAMRLLKLDPASGYKKCARVVGDVIGKYHPHGDQSVYDAMVRLAQTFALRYPLVDGQGNFGNIDGDNAAAYRYTEARLTQVAIDLMDGLDENAVDYRPTYNGEDEEPELFPGLFPNLLANGAAGIAVGMATSIPPHNAAELMNAAVALIDNPSANVLDYVQGPDFPTGGTVIDSPASIAESYTTGRGGFRVRAKIEKVIEKGGGWHLVVSEIPYGVQKGKLIEGIADLINEKKLPILGDVRDESAEDIRIVIEPRSRTVVAEDLINSLYRLSDLETRVPLNLNVLDKHRTPRVMSLQEALSGWLEHQFVVLRRKSEYRLGKIADRLELVAGYIVAFLNLDRVIHIIRTEDEPKPVMIAEFQLTDRQAEAILNMRLRSLRKLEEMELKREQAGLEKEKAELETVALVRCAPAHPDEARSRQDDRALWAGDGSGQAPHRGGRGGTGPRNPARGDDRARADHRDPLGTRLDPRDEGACRGSDGRCTEVQGGRRCLSGLPRPDYRQAAAGRRQWPVLHAGGGQAARRPRLRRARAAYDRPGRRSEHHRPVPGEHRAPAAGCRR